MYSNTEELSGVWEQITATGKILSLWLRSEQLLCKNKQTEDVFAHEHIDVNSLWVRVISYMTLANSMKQDAFCLSSRFSIIFQMKRDVTV